MLRTLRIRNLVIVEELTVEFGPGLNLLTGETGAGKSILVDALGLAVGERADRSLIRSGASRAVVEALFEPGAGSAALEWGVEAGMLDAHDDCFVIRREIATDGANRTLVNGSPATLSMLRELGSRLLELHGQHEQQRLLSAESHLRLLDRFGGHDALLAEVEGRFVAARTAAERVVSLQEADRDREARLIELNEIVREIEALAPEADELAFLERERSVLRHGARVLELLEGIVGRLYDGDSAAAATAATAARQAAELAEFDDGLAELAARLDGAAVDLQDIGVAFRDYRDGRDLDPARLEQVESRRAAIDRLCVKHGLDESGLIELGESARSRIAELGDAEGTLDRARREQTEAEETYAGVAGRLTRARKKTARRLLPAVTRELAELALGNAKLEVGFEPPPKGPSLEREGAQPLHLGPRGAERVELRLAANPGEPVRPLARAASGGELSRLMLALHTVFENAGEGRTLVFDEVDTGVSGAVADAVGSRLARLAGEHQVLCVTHLPQVAAHAERHYRVCKQVDGGRTRASVDDLSSDERVEELARMLGGPEPSTAARSNAKALIRAARRGRADSRRSA